MKTQPSKIMSSFAILAVLLSLVLSSCGGKSDAGSPGNASKESGSLLLLEWVGYENPAYHQAFTEQHPNVDVQFTFMADDAESFAKAKNTPDIDIAHPCVNYWQLFYENDLVQPIDISRLKHWDGVYPELIEMGQFDGKQYFIPWDWGHEAITVRTDKVTTIPEKWSDLWNPEYAGHLSMMDSGTDNFLATALALGFDPYNTTPEQNEQIKQKLIELKPNLLNYWNDQTTLNNMIANGDIWVASTTWNVTYTEVKRAGIPVEYILPEPQAIGWVCGFGISSQTKNLDLVYDYLNAVTAPEANGQMAYDMGYGPGHRDAVQYMDPELTRVMGLENPEALKSVLFMEPINEEQHQFYTDLWVEVKAAP